MKLLMHCKSFHTEKQLWKMLRHVALCGKISLPSCNPYNSVGGENGPLQHFHLKTLPFSFHPRQTRLEEKMSFLEEPPFCDKTLSLHPRARA